MKRIFWSSSGKAYRLEKYEAGGQLREWYFFVGPKKFYTFTWSESKWILDRNTVVGNGTFVDGTKNVEIECIGVRDTIIECLDLLELKGGKKA